MVRTAAIGVQGEIRGLSALLRQFSSLPSVQNLDVAFLGQRIEAAFGENPNGIVRYVGRLGADGRLFYWTPKGELVASGVPISLDPVGWSRTSDPASRGQVRWERPGGSPMLLRPCRCCSRRCGEPHRAVRTQSPRTTSTAPSAW